jgi:hypothetical protein
MIEVPADFSAIQQTVADILVKTTVPDMQTDTVEKNVAQEVVVQ